MRVSPISVWAYAVALIGLGVLGLVFGDFALVWQPVPAWVPGREALAYACGLVSLGAGAGLLWGRTRLAASVLALLYLLLWLALLRVPAIFVAPRVEASWSGCGENAIMLAGALALFAELGPRGAWSTLGATGDPDASAMRSARLMLGIALIPCGLAHLVYLEATAAFVPAWIPGHVAWAFATACGFFAAAAGILFSVYARLAATMVAAMMGVITLLVWVGGVAAAPRDRMQWTGLGISWLIAAGAWVVAETYRDVPWLAARPQRAKGNAPGAVGASGAFRV